jgi:hypothetical protein
MRYEPVRTLADLRALAGSTEGRSLDFKGRVDTSEWWEMAKDIAAFANHVGGTILVGASEQPDGTATFFGIDQQDAVDAAREYENVAKDKCNPRPLVVPDPIALPSGPIVLAVNVDPYPLAPVGAMFYERNKNGAPVTCDAWRFPLRVGKHNVPLQPDQIAMFMEPQIRRTAILLEGIPGAARAKVKLVWVGWWDDKGRPNMSEIEVVMNGVDVAANVLSVSRGSDARIPLDDVESVWEAQGGLWAFRVCGAIDPNGFKYTSRPHQ